MNTGLESLKLDSDINYLGIGAFKDSSLKDVVINSPITKIPFSCFSGCIYLKHFDYPITVTEFGAYSFMDCPFSSFVLKECLSKIDVSAFAYCKNLSDIDWGNVTFIGNEAFKGCAVNKIVFPSCLATIGENAFQNCKNLETVDMSNTNVTNISSFSDCIQLTEFIFPKKLKTIDASCFNGCTSLVELMLPNSLENIYSSAFGNMKSLQKIDLSNTSVTVIPSYCFKNCESLKNVTLNKNTSEIRDHAFYNCSNLTDIYNSYNIEIVYDDAFLETKVFDDAKDGPVMIGSALYYYKGQIEDNEYVVPSNVTCICKEAFSGQSFQSIKLNDKLLYIGKDAFKNCIELLALTIPNSVTTVESCSGCKKLAVLTLNESDTALELGEFKGNKIKKFSMGRNVYSSLDWLTELTTLIIGKKVTELSYKSIPDGKLTDLDLEDADEVLNLGYNKFVNKIKTLYLGRNIKVGTYQDKDKYSPFDDVTTIGNSFISLEDLTIGSKVNAICDYFCQDNTALTSLFIPENVKTIGKKAFYRNYNLNEIIFDEGVESIGESAFGYGEDEFNMNYEIINKAKTFSQITIPSSVKDIYPYAFSGIKVQHLDFSEGVKNLHNRCFMCIKTDSLYLPSSIILGKHCCFTNSKLKFVDASKVKGELNGAFSYNKLLENIILNNELKAIHSDFVFCCSLTKIKLPNKLREIGNGEFLCTPIEHLHIPSETEKVGAEILSSEWNCSYIPSVTLEGNEFSPMVKLDDSFCWSGETVESEKKLKSLFVYKDFEYTINHYTVNGTSETNLGMDSLVIGNIHKFTIKSSSDKRFYPQTAICLSSHLTSCDMWKPSNGKVFVLPGSNLPKDEVEYMYTVNKLNYEKTGDENIVFDGVNNMSFSIEPVFYQNEQEVPFVEVGDYDLSMKINGTSFDGIYPTCLKLSISDNSGIDEITNCTC